MQPARFAIVGGGWRAGAFLQIARAMPDRFEATGVLVRDAEKGRAFEKQWGVRTVRTIEELLKLGDAAFVVVSVARVAAPGIILDLAARGMPVLCETPPAADAAALAALWEGLKKIKGAKVQVAEQYPFQPMNAARIALARSGKLGTVTQAQVSCGHGYHGTVLIRQLLGLQFENVKIRARHVVSKVVEGPGRYGQPTEEKLVDSKQTLAWLDFGGKLATFDFASDQYRSGIRSMRMLVRGERGEINNGEVRYLKDHVTPVSFELERIDAGQDGNMEVYWHKGISGGQDWWYRNPFERVTLSDDDVAVATCMAKMVDHVNGSEGFYGVAEAAQDHYLGILINQAADSGELVQSQPQAWMA